MNINKNVTSKKEEKTTEDSKEKTSEGAYGGFNKSLQNTNFKSPQKFKKPSFLRPQRIMNVRSFGGHR